MKLTLVERQILMNQLSILKVLEKSDDYDESIEILRYGYELFYDHVVNPHEGMPVSDCRFVLDVLDMYRAIETYKERNPQDIDVPKMYGAYFLGFDGNGSKGYLSFTRFLIEDQGKFEEQKKYKGQNDGFNSHGQVEDTYERMLRAWHQLGKKHDLTREQALTILNAAPYPK